jgi:hypothetical protein
VVRIWAWVCMFAKSLSSKSHQHTTDVSKPYLGKVNRTTPIYLHVSFLRNFLHLISSQSSRANNLEYHLRIGSYIWLNTCNFSDQLKPRPCIPYQHRLQCHRISYFSSNSFGSPVTSYNWDITANCEYFL